MPATGDYGSFNSRALQVCTLLNRAAASADGLWRPGTRGRPGAVPGRAARQDEAGGTGGGAADAGLGHFLLVTAKRQFPPHRGEAPYIKRPLSMRSSPTDCSHRIEAKWPFEWPLSMQADAAALSGCYWCCVCRHQAAHPRVWGCKVTRAAERHATLAISVPTCPVLSRAATCSQLCWPTVC